MGLGKPLISNSEIFVIKKGVEVDGLNPLGVPFLPTVAVFLDLVCIQAHFISSASIELTA